MGGDNVREYQDWVEENVDLEEEDKFLDREERRRQHEQDYVAQVNDDYRNYFEYDSKPQPQARRNENPQKKKTLQRDVNRTVKFANHAEHNSVNSENHRATKGKPKKLNDKAQKKQAMWRAYKAQKTKTTFTEFKRSVDCFRKDGKIVIQEKKALVKPESKVSPVEHHSKKQPPVVKKYKKLGQVKFVKPSLIHKPTMCELGTTCKKNDCKFLHVEKHGKVPLSMATRMPKVYDVTNAYCGSALPLDQDDRGCLHVAMPAHFKDVAFIKYKGSSYPVVFEKKIASSKIDNRLDDWAVFSTKNALKEKFVKFQLNIPMVGGFSATWISPHDVQSTQCTFDNNWHVLTSPADSQHTDCGAYIIDHQNYIVGMNIGRETVDISPRSVAIPVVHELLNYCVSKN
jgi:hypothetical protein